MSREELFFDYMWHIGVMDKFVINCIKNQFINYNSISDVQKILSKACNVGCLFVWDETIEGWNFWHTVSYFGEALCQILKKEKRNKKIIDETIEKNFKIIYSSIIEKKGDELHNDYYLLIKRIKSYTNDRFPKIAIE